MKKNFIKTIMMTLALGTVLSFPVYAATGWEYNRGTWFYYDSNNELATGWKNINGSWYHFNKVQTQSMFKGGMNTGWFKDDDGKWYYLYKNGAMAYNTIIDNRYVLGKDGALASTTEPVLNPVVSATPTINENIYSYNQKATNIEKNTIKKKDIKNSQDLSTYLKENFSTLETPIGTLKFTFSIDENDDSWFEYDYRIFTSYGTIENDKYNLYSFSPLSLDYSTKISDKDKNETIELLKEHQRKIAKLAMEVFPNKKMEGSYYRGWYKYAYIKMDWKSTDFFSWNNYDRIDEDYFGKNAYYNTDITGFKWTSENDDYFN